MWAVVPIKDMTEAKQRLGTMLRPDERRGLFQAMAEDVVEILSSVSALDGVMIVSGDPFAERLSRRYGTRLLYEKEQQGHTAAVAHAARVLSEEGADGMLQLPGDVPLVSVAEIHQVLHAHGPAPAMTIVPSRDEKGSNCILCSPPAVIPLTFGDNSFYPHLETARRHGLHPHIVTLPGIGLDIDMPDDLRWLLRQKLSHRTGRFLIESGIAEGFMTTIPALQIDRDAGKGKSHR